MPACPTKLILEGVYCMYIAYSNCIMYISK